METTLTLTYQRNRIVTLELDGGETLEHGKITHLINTLNCQLALQGLSASSKPACSRQAPGSPMLDINYRLFALLW